MVGCAAFKCLNRSDNDPSKKFSFVRFPKDQKLLAIWAKACKNNKITANSRLCTSHFENDQFIRLHNATKLLDYAVPTLFSFIETPTPKLMMTTQPSDDNIMNQPKSKIINNLTPITIHNNEIFTKSIIRAPVMNKQGTYFWIFSSNNKITRGQVSFLNHTTLCELPNYRIQPLRFH